MSKHAVVALSEALFLNLKDAGAPVGVSVLCPSRVRTSITESDLNRRNFRGPAHPSIRWVDPDRSSR